MNSGVSKLRIRNSFICDRMDEKDRLWRIQCEYLSPILKLHSWYPVFFLSFTLPLCFANVECTRFKLNLFKLNFFSPNLSHIFMLTISQNEQVIHFDTRISILVSKRFSCTFCKLVSRKIYVKPIPVPSFLNSTVHTLRFLFTL